MAWADHGDIISLRTCDIGCLRWTGCYQNSLEMGSVRQLHRLIRKSYE